MKTTILILLLSICLSSCQAYVYEDTDSDGCYDPKPYSWTAEIHRRYYDYGGNYQGECAVWYIGEGWFEEWCNWPDVCGWEYVEEYWEQEQ